MKLYLIRHTTIQVPENVCYGCSDLPVASTFEEEKSLLHAKLPSKFDHIYSSPLSRCHQLAQSLTGDDFNLDERLLECDFGDWELMPWDQLPPKTVQAWMDDFVHVRPAKGESFIDVQKRVLSFLNEMHEHHADADPVKTIAVVSHAGVLRTMIAIVLGIPLVNAFKLQFSYGSVSLVQNFYNRRSLHYFNR